MKKLLLAAVVLLGAVTSASAQFTFTSLDFPGGTLTSTNSINNQGDIVGAYRITPPRHALLIKDGQFLPLDPTSVLGTTFSAALGNNDRGDVVGEFQGDDGFFHGFLLSGGVLTTLDFPGASDTFAFGINESGTVVGYWDILDSAGNVLIQHGFTWDNGNFSQVDFPGAGDTVVFGINARGDLVGAWDTGLTSTTAHGFVFTKGNFTSLDVPFAGATLTEVTAINAQGSIVGIWLDATTQHGFLAEGANFTSLDFPGAAVTGARSINSAGQIVGNYINPSNSQPHGYLAQPGNKEKP